METRTYETDPSSKLWTTESANAAIIGVYPQQQEDDLVMRLKRSVHVAGALSRELKEIRNQSLMLGVEWSSSLESLLAHMEIDLDWLGAEVKKLMGG